MISLALPSPTAHALQVQVSKPTVDEACSPGIFSSSRRSSVPDRGRLMAALTQGISDRSIAVAATCRPLSDLLRVVSTSRSPPNTLAETW